MDTLDKKSVNKSSVFASPDKNKEVLKKIVIPEGIDINKSNKLRNVTFVITGIVKGF